MRLRVAHVSLQFADSDKQHTSDIEKIFKRAVDRKQAWITGTESGPGAGNTSRELIRVAKETGYFVWVPEHQANGIASRTDCWIAVRKSLVDGEIKKGFTLAVPGADQLRGEIDMPPGKRWGPKGVVHVEFDTTAPGLGPISVGAAHYLTDSRNPSSPYWDLNKRLAETIGDWAREQGKGRALVFYGGDQNMADNKNDEPQGDTFFGEPLTSTWDELRKWENTGHGNIDVIASYNKDGRVKAMRTNALNDREFHLHTDHFYVEAVFDVEPMNQR